MSTIKVGIIGAGRAGSWMHCPELACKKDKFEIAAICDIDPKQFAAKAKEHNCRTYTNIKDILADKDIELFTIATRSKDHVKHALMALETGKYVFTEKPIALSYKDALKLKDAADKTGRLFFRQNRRFEPGFMAVMDAVKSGLVGEVFEVKLRRNGYGRRADWQSLIACGGGQLNNWGPHIIDHALQFLGSPVADMWSDLKLVCTVGDAEDHLKIILKGENGRIVDLEISGGSAYNPEPECLVLGKRGAISFDGAKTLVTRYLDPAAALPELKADPGTPQGFGSESLKWIETKTEVGPQSTENMARIWDFVYETIRNGKPFPIKTDEAVQVVKIVSDVKKQNPSFKKATIKI